MKATEILKYYVESKGLNEFCFKPLSDDVVQNSFFKLTFKFANDDEGNIVLMTNDGVCPKNTSEELLRAITSYKIDVTNTPFNPKLGDTYWYFDTWEDIINDTWEDLPFEIAMFKCGMVFRTKEEALNAKEELVKNYGK